MIMVGNPSQKIVVNTGVIDELMKIEEILKECACTLKTAATASNVVEQTRMVSLLTVKCGGKIKPPYIPDQYHILKRSITSNLDNNALSVLSTG
jgi:hypothetical protein